MYKSYYIFHTSLYKRLRSSFNCLCHIVDTAYCRNNPYLISHSHLAVFSLKSKEGFMSGFFYLFNLWNIFIFKQITKCCFYIMSMYPVTGFYILFCNSDSVSVLYNILTGFYILKCHLMSGGNFTVCLYTLVSYSYFFSLWQCIQCHTYIIQIIDFDIIHFLYLLAKYSY